VVDQTEILLPCSPAELERGGGGGGASNNDLKSGHHSYMYRLGKHTQNSLGSEESTPIDYTAQFFTGPPELVDVCLQKPPLI